MTTRIVNKKLNYLILAASFGILAVFAILFRQFHHSRTPALVRVVVAQPGDFFLYAPLYIALDANHFREQGLDVRLVNTGGDERTWAAVVSGSADFGVSDPTFTVVSGQRGMPGRVVASIVNGVPFWGVTFREDIPVIREPSELAHYSVATFPSPSTAYTLQAQMFRDGGLIPNIRQGSFGTLLQSIRSGQADIALELEPNVSTSVSQGARVVYSLSERYGDFAITGLTTTPDTLARRSDLVQRTVSAIELALRDLHNQPENCRRLLSRRFPDVPSDVSRLALERALQAGVVPSTTVVGESAWTKAVRLRRLSGDITTMGAYSQFVVTSFAQRAHSSH